ncbi:MULTISPECIES: GLPGLI family protein [unclassified Leeuwenhoekiella]|uniref:GLPGLI family protein n=1 Tax=unclassified Leeuwenhoekiella TaxID=2615029 RepID=UPI000C4A4B7A|nr:MULTISPECIES: GLPGLI family protein [unclassified Leeuwenhoekiella]MAW94449.1 hypothetical protein [Leeuwenhoekiella sp.]MBA81127.1 hypothetical protein [Leeuwenhoekiella sp.]|tara:strand:+ start:57122 stop:57829 length:708 start_codon:yes stop_codon:yes gene_type:complete
MYRFCITLFFIYTNGFAQSINSGFAVYSVRPASKLVQGLSNNNKIYTEIKDAANHLNQLEYHLYFNADIAYFEFQEQLIDQSNRSVENASKLARNTPFYILQASGEVFNEIEFMGDDYLIEQHCSDYDWQILNETKVIQGYSCNKATAIIKGHNDKPTEIIAYFCPQIPFNYGPKGYCGLPGMILSVEDDVIIYEMIKIKFENIDPISFKKSGIVKTREAFSSYIDSLAKATFGR